MTIFEKAEADLSAEEQAVLVGVKTKFDELYTTLTPYIQKDVDTAKTEFYQALDVAVKQLTADLESTGAQASTDSGTASGEAAAA